MAKEKLKIMLSSTLVDSEVIIEQIFAPLVGYGYEIYSIPGRPPIDSCLRAVEECDFFLGIIFPRYGTKGLSERKERIDAVKRFVRDAVIERLINEVLLLLVEDGKSLKELMLAFDVAGTTMYKNNSRNSSKFRGFNPLQLTYNLTGNCHASGTATILILNVSKN